MELLYRSIWRFQEDCGNNKLEFILKYSFFIIGKDFLNHEEWSAQNWMQPPTHICVIWFSSRLWISRSEVWRLVGWSEIHIKYPHAEGLIYRRALVWRRLVFPKRLRLFTKLRGVAFRRTVIFRSLIHFESNVWGKTPLMRAENRSWRKGEWLQWTARNRHGQCHLVRPWACSVVNPGWIARKDQIGTKIKCQMSLKNRALREGVWFTKLCTHLDQCCQRCSSAVRTNLCLLMILARFYCVWSI